MLGDDIYDVEDKLTAAIPWVVGLDLPRKRVLAEMAFNMGVNGLLQFRTTLGLVRQGDDAAASVEMLRSAWAMQVGARAKRLAALMASPRVAA